jgi:hypothetical protein
VTRNWTTGWMLALLVLTMAACSALQAADGSVVPSAAASPSLPPSPSRSPQPGPTMPQNLSADQVAALNSLTKVDEHPLYTMHYRHSYALTEADRLAFVRSDTDWGCSLFAALADRQNVLYGRNFDWLYTPGLMLFYTPDDGYASVAMTAMSFLDFAGRSLDGLDQASLAEREPLLGAPAWAFDGMNAKGLVVGWARVPAGRAPYDPDKLTVPSVYLTREILDHAATVDEAIEVVQSYNVSFGPRQPLHYLVADRSGKSALLEFLDGKLVVTRNEQPWQTAVNVLPSNPAKDPDNAGWRYEILTKKLNETQGSLSTEGAMGLLASVRSGTQWSAVYHPNTGDVEIAMGMDYTNVHTFNLDMQP